jgi:hypothetical protein
MAKGKTDCVKDDGHKHAMECFEDRASGGIESMFASSGEVVLFESGN